MLGMFLRCPHQFERRYLRGEIIPPGIAARRGSATHKAAQINHEQKLHSQADLPAGDLQDAVRDHYVRLVQEEGVFIPKDQLYEKDTLLAHGLDAAVRLTKLYRHALAPAIQAGVSGRKTHPGRGPGLTPAGHHRRAYHR
jgi:hypothetical protein